MVGGIALSIMGGGVFERAAGVRMYPDFSSLGPEMLCLFLLALRRCVLNVL